DLVHEPVPRRQARRDAAPAAQRRGRRRGAPSADLLCRGRPGGIRRGTGLPDHPLRPVRQPGRAAAQRHEGDARRYRAAHAGPQGRDDQGAGQCAAQPPAGSETVRFRGAGPGRGLMASVDVPALAAILREAAKREILPRFRHLDAGMVRQKSEAIDLVTEADEEAERFIRAEVAKLMPGALFVGEEAVAADPPLLDALDEAELAVVVDPVDGTANFAAGLPLFAVMASVVRKGETVAGIIYDPMGDDFVLAEKGSGAFTRYPDGRPD